MAALKHLLRMSQAEGGTAEENPEEERAARIDTSIPVQAGSRIAVVQ